MSSYLVSGWITILVLISGLQLGNPQDGEALVCTDPVRLDIGAGQTKTIHILLVNAKNIYGIDLQAAFDPSVVEVVDANSKQMGVQMISGVFLKPDFVIRNLADNQAGTLRYIVTQLNPTLPVNGKGILLTIQFRGKLSGTSSKLTITSAVIANRRGSKQPVTTRGADLVIVPRKPPTLTALPSSLYIPANPTSPAATLTRTKAQPTALPSTTATANNPSAQPGATATRNDPPAQPGATTAKNNPARAAEENSALSDQVLMYVTVGGFSGTLLFSGLSVWLLAAKRRKGRTAKSK